MTTDVVMEIVEVAIVTLWLLATTIFAILVAEDIV